MASDSFTSAMNALKNSQERGKLLNSLITLRKQLEWPRNKDNMLRLRGENCLKSIVATLSSSHKKILDTSLSILGNCCLEKHCTRDFVRQYNIFSHLNQLLKRYPKEDSINGRAFRILGNICIHNREWNHDIIYKKPQIVIHAITFLENVARCDNENDSNASEATINMSIRFLRQLLNGETQKMLFARHNILNVVGMMLIRFSNKWKENKKDANILLNVVRLLQELCRYMTYPYILKLRKTDKGDALVCLSEILHLCPTRVIKIVMKLVKLTQLKSDLPIPEIFDNFVDYFNNHSIIKDFNCESEQYIKCVCYLLDHPGNRDVERCGRKGVSLLISILKELQLVHNNEVECAILIVTTLNKCRYKSLILEQLNCDIIQILIDKYKFLVGNFDKLYLPHKGERKRKCSLQPDLECTKPKGIRHRSTNAWSSDDESDYIFLNNYCDGSPSSSVSDCEVVSWTSCLSPPSSPQPQSVLSESDSDDYSPVCSENEMNDPPTIAHSENESEMDKLSDFCEHPDEEFNQNDLTKSNVGEDMKYKFLSELLSLVRTYVFFKPPLTQLCTPELSQAIIKCAIYYDMLYKTATPFAIGILQMLREYDYFIPLISTDFIPTVYDLLSMPHGRSCIKCVHCKEVGNSVLDNLTKIAESCAITGDIAHTLLRGDFTIKTQLALVIPFIIVQRAILSKLMLNCGGLEILIEILRQQSKLKERSIKALCVMASAQWQWKQFDLDDSKLVKGALVLPAPVINTYELDEGCNSIVTFQFDDGSLIKADRVLLSKKSDYFSRLLDGDFKESHEDVIALPNVNSKSFTCLLALLQCKLDKTRPHKIGFDLDAHLDAITLCDRFLMPEIGGYLVCCIKKFRLSGDTIPMIYQWSLEAGTNLLRDECVEFALIGDTAFSKRVQMFADIFEMGCIDELVEDIRNLLMPHLSVDYYTYQIKIKRFVFKG